MPALVAAAVAFGLPDPADNLDRIEAAVVNLDEPVTVQGETVPLGRQVVAALTAGVGLDGEPLVQAQDGSRLTWTLTDADGADEGLGSGRYAAAVTIPAGFSAAATSLSASDPAQASSATVDVRTAEDGPVGDGAVAALVGGVVADTLGQELTTTYLDGLYVGFSGVRTSLGDAASGAGELGTGSQQLAEGLAATDDGARQLADGLDELSGGTADLADGSQQLADGAGASADGASSLADGLEQLRSGTAALPGSTRQLADGAAGVADGTGQLAGQLGALADGVDRAATGAEALPDATAGLSALAAGVDTGAQDLRSRTSALAADAADALAACRDAPAEGTPADCSSLEQLAADAGAVSDGAAGLGDSTAGLAGGASALAGQVAPLATGLREAADGAAAATAGAGTLAAGARQVADGASALADGTAPLASGVAAAADGADQLADGSALLADGAGELAGGAGQLAEGASGAAAGADGLVGGTGRLATGAEGLADGADQLATGLGDGAAQVPDYDAQQREQLAAVAASPVGTTADDPSTYERALAYLAALALGIGGLVTFLVLRAVPERAVSSRDGAVRLALRAFGPAAAVVGGQTVLVTGVLALALDLGAARTAALAGAVLVAGLALAATNQALVAWLGGTGRLLSLGLLALSIPAALVGTAPDAVRTLVDLTPLAPATDLVRAAVLAGTAGGAVPVLLVWTVAGLLVSVLAAGRARSVPAGRLAGLAAAR